MPYKNYTTLDQGEAFLSDGTKLFNFSEVMTLETTDETAKPDDTWRFIDFDKTDTFTGTFRVTRYLKNYLKYGWVCKGPVRKRLLKRMKRLRPAYYYNIVATKEMAENG